MTEQITENLKFLFAGQKTKDRLLIVGGSSSELTGGQIGKASNPQVAEAVMRAVFRLCREYEINLAVQCCEHLNRALAVEREFAERRGLTIVSAVPQNNAGGAFATAVWGMMGDPVLAESVQADFGVDVGDTLIGMHLKPVAVPIRPPHMQVGSAHITMAYSRPKLIGGERAKYR